MGRRSNNEGSIYHLSNGKWRAQFTQGSSRFSFTGKTKNECQRWINSLKQEKLETPNILESNQSLQHYLENWIAQAALNIRAGTLYQYQLYANKYIFPVLGTTRIRDITYQRIQSFYLDLYKANTGVRTIKIIHSVLHHSLEDAVIAGMLNRNPAHGTKLPKTEQKEIRIYNEDQVNQLLLAAQGDRYEALYHLALATGMRQSELLGLQWSEVDFNRGILKVEKQLKRNFKEGDYFSQTKTKNGRRVLAIGPATIQKLQEHRNTQNLDKLIAGERWKENNLVFPSSIGTPMNQMNLYTRFIHLCQEAGLPRIRFHDLRHTSASILLNHKVPMIVVSRRLGHYKVSFTMDTYGHMIPEMQEEAAILIDNLITPVAIQLHPIAPEPARIDQIPPA